jgi:hypothetical protein
VLTAGNNSVSSSPCTCSNSDTTKPSNVANNDKKEPINEVSSDITRQINAVGSNTKKIGKSKPAISQDQECPLHYNLTLVTGNDEFKHRKKRSVDNITDNSDNSANIGIATSTTTIQAPFALYIPGFYGAPCFSRAFNYLTTHPNAFSFTEVGCACIGNCPFPLAPNPDAANFFKAVYTSTSQLVDRIKSNAPYLAVTAVIVILSLAGKLFFIYLVLM